ncbi:MAG TPA: AAA family ATPase [Planctomycetota bacterium]|nr:AAA family ATPase [Planctomycetota bacterium]
MITRIRIKNFKSLADVDITLDPVTVLIGKAGSGKTNFVKAIRCLRGLVGGSGRPDGERYSFFSDDFEIRFEIDFRVNGSGNYAYAIAFHYLRNGNYAGMSECLRQNGRDIFASKLGSWIKAPNVKDLPSAGAVTISAITGISEIAIARTYLLNGISCFDFPGDILLANGGSGEGGLIDNGANCVGVFGALAQNLGAIENYKQIGAALSAISPSVTNAEILNGNLHFGHSIGGLNFPLVPQFESEGFRRYFAHLVAMYQSPSKQALFFEEPEKGIHPGALSSLADQFKLCAEEGRGQVILTTHSPQLLDAFEPEHIRVVEMHDTKTHIGLLAPEQRSAIEDGLMHPRELLTVNNARTEKSPDNVVEV